MKLSIPVKRINFLRHTRNVILKSNHIDKIFKYKMLKLLRSYLDSKGQERVKKLIFGGLGVGTLTFKEKACVSPFGGFKLGQHKPTIPTN